MAHSSFLGIVDMERGFQGRILDTNNILVLLLTYIYTFLTISSYVYVHTYYEREQQ